MKKIALRALIKFAKVGVIALFWGVIIGLILLMMIIGFERDGEKSSSKSKEFIVEQGFVFNEVGDIVGTTKN